MGGLLFCEKFLCFKEIRGKGGGECFLFTIWVLYFYGQSVKRETNKAESGRRIVACVAEDGVAYRFHVDAKLVCATCFW